MKYYLVKISNDPFSKLITFSFYGIDAPGIAIEITLPPTDPKTRQINKIYYDNGPYHEFEFIIS